MTDAVEVFGAERGGRWVVTCDHASNRVPDDVAGGDLGVPPEDMHRHIAYDVGALGVAQAMGTALDAPVVASKFSRLVIDPNRGEDDPTLLMQIYDGSIIPANRGVSGAELERRLDRFHRPYHRALAQVIARRNDPILVAVHSFTPQLRGRDPRPWHVSVLYAGDTRLAYPLLARLQDEKDLCVGDNEPYSGHLPGDALDQHGTVPGRLHVLIEVRNDLIETPAAQEDWGARLAGLLEAAAQSAEL
ncbi:N-formylglutamate amidohydrolase [Rhodobacteraceae bacterium N5(2021)]|uniref:N-formylglutamate amidohydrolase n=1 Tax=Gymnodinialimonas phycosphaerae TaxID=2841589 RepID=A0A975TUU4_9RHOB|nr:N-formylglutamate amidohydrolase [Gymnodinialimonas phycosphaerae]MBY4894518.1 N-formylglutamate amidohydrolase [Gymnodinialimonas phycosphaerae]